MLHYSTTLTRPFNSFFAFQAAPATETKDEKKDEKKADRPKSPSLFSKLIAPFKGDKKPKSPKKEKKEIEVSR